MGMTRIALCALLLVLLAVPALADDSAIEAEGGAVAMLSEGQTSVRMVLASITADVCADDSRVRCEYLLRNEGRGRMVTLGFPDMPGRYPGDQIPDARLQRFRSWADGRRLRVRLYFSPHKKDAGFDRWYVRRLWFGRGQTRKIVNTYIQPNGEDSMGGRWFPYTIWTAGSWKGPIGRLRLVVRWREPYLWSLCTYGPMKLPEVGGAPSVSGDWRTLTWSCANVEPTPKHAGGISLYFTPGWTRAGADGKPGRNYEASERFLVYSGSTMAPLRRIAGLMGLWCVWKNRVVSLTDGAGQSFVCRVGSRPATANGERVTLARAPRLWAPPKSSKEFAHAYAPTRAVCQAFGWQCSLDYRQCAVLLYGPRASSANRPFAKE